MVAAVVDYPLYVVCYVRYTPAFVTLFGVTLILRLLNVAGCAPRCGLILQLRCTLRALRLVTFTRYVWDTVRCLTVGFTTTHCGSLHIRCLHTTFTGWVRIGSSVRYLPTHTRVTPHAPVGLLRLNVLVGCFRPGLRYPPRFRFTFTLRLLVIARRFYGCVYGVVAYFGLRPTPHLFWFGYVG